MSIVLSIPHLSLWLPTEVEKVLIGKFRIVLYDVCLRLNDMIYMVNSFVSVCEFQNGQIRVNKAE